MPPLFLSFLVILLFALAWFMIPREDPPPEVRGPLRFMWWLNRGYCVLVHQLRTEVPTELPAHGPALIVANHTCGIDHMLLQSGCERILSFMIAQEYYDHWFLNPFCKLVRCIPVKRDGRDLSATRAALRLLDMGCVVPIFPEGRILPKSGREIGEGKQGAAYIALRAKVPVVPAYIRGTPETNNIGKSLTTPSAARVVYGPRVELADLFPQDGDGPNRDNLDTATARVMAAIRALQNHHPPE